MKDTCSTYQEHVYNKSVRILTSGMCEDLWRLGTQQLILCLPCTHESLGLVSSKVEHPAQAWSMEKATLPGYGACSRPVWDMWDFGLKKNQTKSPKTSIIRKYNCIKSHLNYKMFSISHMGNKSMWTRKSIKLNSTKSWCGVVKHFMIPWGPWACGLDLYLTTAWS